MNQSNQGRRKLPKGGAATLLDQSDNAAKGSVLEVSEENNSAQSAEKIFCLNFQFSGWALVAFSYFKDYRKRRFQTICSH